MSEEYEDSLTVSDDDQDQGNVQGDQEVTQDTIEDKQWNGTQVGAQSCDTKVDQQCSQNEDESLRNGGSKASSPSEYFGNDQHTVREKQDKSYSQTQNEASEQQRPTPFNAAASVGSR
eukprot:TRINITY_DN16415_c0_g1_i7.p4 TRINITY_DN16415_c0_g1~~TRINITY_DN16415_c0_g1_i7.p4  ORF type:complete len:118 (-),score=18.31 TRINITY_DN16415_c0_g1_i7:53-406(-)